MVDIKTLKIGDHVKFRYKTRRGREILVGTINRIEPIKSDYIIWIGIGVGSICASIKDIVEVAE